MLRPLLAIVLPTTLGPCTTFLVPPRAVVDAECFDPTCQQLMLSSHRSRGLDLELTWFLPDGTTTNEPTLLVPRELLDLGGARLRVSNNAGVAWAELHDLDDIDAIIDVPDPVSPFVVLESGSCRFGSMALDPPGVDAPVGGCVADADAIGMRWRTDPLTGPTLDHGAYLHVGTDTPYLYELRPLWAATYTPYFTVAPFVTPAPVAVYSSRKVTTPSELTTPLPPAFLGTPPPLHNPLAPPSAWFSVWQVITPGTVLLGQWVELSTTGGFDPTRPYFGADVIPKTAGFRITCPMGIDQRKASLTDPNLPVFERIPVGLDLDGDGVPTPADCDDFERHRAPGLPDVPFDGWDADCSGTDFDFDFDGFGSDQGGGTDCDDADPMTFPGAPEVLANGIDEDCDALVDETCPDGAYELAVPWDLPTVQAALDAATAGDRICVEPGVWTGPLTVPALPLTLFGAADGVVIDGMGAGSTLTVAAGAGPDTVVSGLTVTGGLALRGGGLHLVDASPTLLDLTLLNNQAERGGGAWLQSNGPPILARGLQFIGNTADLDGGGLIHAGSSELTVIDAVFEGNTALAGSGGGLVLTGTGAVELRESILVDNRASAPGGALSWRVTGPLNLDHLTIVGNWAPHAAGVFLQAHNGTAVNCDLVPGVQLTASVLVGNVATAPLGVTGLAVGPLGSVGRACLTLDRVDLWDPAQVPLLQAPELGDPFATGAAISVDPELQTWSAALAPLRWDVHLAPGSPLRTLNGGYGALAVDWYEDLDGDGLPDGWEVDHGLDPGVDDSGLDEDGDGISHAVELIAGTWPLVGDTDGDGVGDGAELAGGTDALDPGEW